MKEKSAKQKRDEELRCAKQSFSCQAGESPVYLKLSQQGSTESWGEAGNRKPKRRQGGYRLQAERLNGLSPEILD